MGDGFKRKKKAIPEELIRALAYEIWKTREQEGKDGNSETDWHEAREYLESSRWNISKSKLELWEEFQLGITNFGKLLILPFCLIWQLPDLFANSESRTFALEIVRTLISFLGLFATVVAGIGFYFNYIGTKEKLISDRYPIAIQQISNSEETVRIGGIYSLEEIAKDSQKDYWTVIEVLTSYVRQKSPLPNEIQRWIKIQSQKEELTENEEQKLKEDLKKLPGVNFDVQAALTVIARHNIKQEESQKLNLSFSNLKEANLNEGNFKGANFNDSCLLKVDFQDAILNSANLERAFLTQASLMGADLRETKLRLADFTEANLRKANLYKADLNQAKLKEVGFLEANLSFTNLIKANLTQASLYGANLEKAFLMESVLHEAVLMGANLTEANFTGANLSGAKLGGAKFVGASLNLVNLKQADFTPSDRYGKVQNLTPQQVKSACFWEEATYDEEFSKQLESSPPSKGLDCSIWEKHI
jgi:uncharacterized protein YjbI with pentapeptide repeats